MKKTLVLCFILGAGAVMAGPLAAGHDKFLGSAASGGKQSGVIEDPLFTNYWNQVTPHIFGCHSQFEPERDAYYWDGLDYWYGYAQTNHLKFQTVAFLFDCFGFCPKWLKELPAEEIRRELEEAMRLYFERYPETDMATVVNEPFQQTPDPVIRDALGGNTDFAWVRWMYEKARQCAPADCKLLINENNVLKKDGRLNQYKQLVAVLKKDDLVDGIGCQGHWLEDVTADDLHRRLDELAELDLPVYITEYDVHAADDEAQKAIYARQFPVMWEHPAVRGITLWGYKQGHMWRKAAYLVRTDGSERPAMPWLRDYLRKSDGVR